MNKILIIQTGKLGDMVCTTPVFRAIKERYPNASVVVAGAAINKDVLFDNPHIAVYWDFRTMTAERIRAERFDAGVLMTPNPAMLRLMQQARVPTIVVPKVVGGFSPLMTLRYRLYSFFATRVAHRMGHYAPGEYLNMLKPLGIDASDTRKELWVTAEAQAAADAMLAPYAGKKKIAIAPGAGNKIKEWPPERFNEVAKALVERGATVVVVGGPADKALAQIVIKGLPSESVLDTTGKLSVEELKGLVRRMNLFVSADTGPIYIAEAFGVPTVDIVGPMDEREQPPRGPKHVVLVPPRKAPVLHIMNARMYDVVEARRQVEALSVSDVMRAVNEVVNL